MSKNSRIDRKSEGLAKGHGILDATRAQFSPVFVKMDRLLGDRRRSTGSLIGLNFGRFYNKIRVNRIEHEKSTKHAQTSHMNLFEGYKRR